MKRTSIICFIILFFLISGSFRPPKNSPHFTIQLLAPGVWAAINNDNYGHAICNAGIIDLGDQTLIFDPFMNLDAANDLKKFAKQLTKKEATLVVNSHYHNDHVRGNQLFLPAAIISTRWTRDRMAVSEPEDLAWEKINAPKLLATSKNKLNTASGKEKEELPLWIGYYEAMITNGPLMKTTLPNVTFNDSLWIHGTKRSLILLEQKNGHSGSDLILVLPKEGIVFMGDLLFEKRHPYLGDGQPIRWIEYLDALYSNSALNIFVPGHGKVGGKQIVHEMRNYITELQEIVTNGFASGKADSIIRKTPMPTSYDDWKFSRFYAFNMRFLVASHQQVK